MLKRKAADLASDDAKKPKANGSITAFFGQPKPAAAGGAAKPDAAVAVAKKFDKEAWVAKLTEEQRELLKLEIETMDESWLAVLKEELVTEGFLKLKRFLKSEKEAGKKVFPPEAEIYSWSRHTPLPSVKAVIVGQDPYHKIHQAHGLCFSVRPPTPAPPSLGNIYGALKKDYPTFQPPPKNGGLLTPWADRGVLMLNTCLTVRAAEPTSHSNRGWERLTQKVIDTVARTRSNGVVFLAWGAHAQKTVKDVNATKHLILKGVHPSPLAQTRGPGFVNCGHFKETNKWLKQRYGDGAEIDWDLNVAPEKAGV